MFGCNYHLDGPRSSQLKIEALGTPKLCQRRGSGGTSASTSATSTLVPPLRCLAECTGVIPDIFDFTAEASHFATLVRALCGRPETSRRPGHTIGMEREHPVDSRSAKTALVLREGARKKPLHRIIQITGDHSTVFRFFTVSATTTALRRPGHTLE